MDLGLLPPSDTTVPQELLRLRRAIHGTSSRPGLAHVLEALSSDPYAVLETHAVSVPFERARRVHPIDVIRAYSHGHNLDAAGRPIRVRETQVRHSVDVYENRLVRAFHDEVSRRFRRLQRRLRAAGTRDAAVETEQMQEQLRRARLMASFLDNVGLPRQLPTRLTMVLLRSSEYRVALQGFLEFRRSTAIRLEEPALDSSLTELPRLYETWNTMRAIDTLARIGINLGYTLELEHLLYRDAAGFFVQLLRDGRPAIILHHHAQQRTVRLTPQRNYHRGTKHLHSASYDQRPDIAIEIEDAEGDVHVLIFDPKYKLDSEQVDGEITDARPKKIDIDKMHAYRDAIRNANDERIVTYAAILYPGPPPVPFGRGIEAISAVPGHADVLDRRLEDLITAALTAARPAA